MAKKGKKKGKKKKQKQTIDVTLRLNVELEQRKRAQPRKQRVKRITSRKRMNLREMRQSMPGAGGPQAFANPAFYGNVKQLNDSALNQFQNQRYSLEQQVRESSAEQKAMLAAGKVQAAQQVADALTAQAQQLAQLQQQFLGQSQQVTQFSAAAGLERGRAQAAEQQLQQQQAQVEQQQVYDADAATIPQAQLRERLIPILNAHFGQGHFTPEGITDHMLGRYEATIRKAIAGEPGAQQALIEKFDRTTRGRQTQQPEPAPAPEPQPESDELPPVSIYHQGSDTDDEASFYSDAGSPSPVAPRRSGRERQQAEHFTPPSSRP